MYARKQQLYYDYYYLENKLFLITDNKNIHYICQLIDMCAYKVNSVCSSIYYYKNREKP